MADENIPGIADVFVESDDPNAVRVDPTLGSVEIPLDDGSVLVDLSPEGDDADDDEDFYANLAEKIQEDELNRIADDLLRGIEIDEQSRETWVQNRTRGIDILGIELKEPRGDVGTSSAPLEGMATVTNPLLLEAVLRFQATARGELLPSTGPVKVRNDGDETGMADDLAETLERDMNHFLTAVATEYYPDTDRMLFLVGFGGVGFKKVYNCPLRQRPVSESVDAKDIIVSNAATDLKGAGRVTHKIMMRPSVLKRMQLVDAYRDVTLLPPTPTKSQVDEKIAQVQGIQPYRNERPEDQDHTIFECYCELDIAGFEHKKRGKATGLPLPYRVAIEEDSRKILEIRRNWNPDDEMCLAKTVLVKYGFVPALGFYDLGLLNILGNSSNALTAAWREMLDAGMFASFPGFLYSKSAGRQNTNEFRIPPGGGMPVDTGGMPINQAIMALPYRDITSGLANLVTSIEAVCQRLGGTADMSVSEGKQEAPVGTTLALIEQATKVMDAVHKRLHASQAEEFQLLKDCFRDDPEAFWRHNKSAANNWDREKFLMALDNSDLVPAADPNTPSHMHRIMKAVAVKQLQQANPELYNAKEVDTRILRMIGWNDPEALFAPPQPPAQPGMDPALQAQIALKSRELDIKAASAAAKAQTDQAEMRSKEQIAVMQLAKELAVHPGSAPVADTTLKQPVPDVPPTPVSTGGRVF